jgi:hypothetical protein
MKILVWETSPNLEPISGREWLFNSRSLRDAVAHKSYELGGKLSQNRQSATLPDGNRLFATVLEK